MANKNKATHQGHCQACNCLQKLPAGVLAKHGYQVAGYGFFNGVCMGSNHLPLEQDKSIVEASIVWAKKMISAKRLEIEKVAAERGIHFAWFDVYIPATWRGQRSGHVWEYCPVALLAGDYTRSDGYTPRYGYVYTSQGSEPMMRHSINAESTQDLCTKLNAKYITSLEKDIKELKGYIADQKHRIEVWHAQPLKPITEEK